MPCRDFYDDNPSDYYGPKLKDKDAEIERLKKQVSFSESALCLTLGTLKDVLNGIAHDFDAEVKTNPLDILEFDESGITRNELEKWWEKHKKLDEQHRARRKEMLRKQALAKLSKEERNALGYD